MTLKLFAALLISFPLVALAAPMNNEPPILEIYLKVTSFDAKTIKAETKENEKVVLPRRAIKKTILTNQFHKYEVSLLDWIDSGNGNK